MLQGYSWLNISRFFINQFVDVTCITFPVSSSAVTDSDSET